MRGRAGLGSGAREPGTLGSASAAATAQEPRSLDSPGCRSPCACAAPVGGKNRGKKTSCSRVCVHWGCPGPMSRWSRMLEASDPRPRGSPLAGPSSARRSPGHLPREAQGPGRARGQEEAPEGWTLGAAAHPPFREDAHLCAVRSRLGFLPLSVRRPRSWEPGLFTQSQVTFEVEELENHREGTPHRPCGDPPSLNTLWVPPCRGQRRAYADGEDVVSGGEGLFMCGIAWTRRCAMWECGCAPRLPRGVRGGRGLKPGSPGPGAGRGLSAVGRSAGEGLGHPRLRAPREGRTRLVPGEQNREP